MFNDKRKSPVRQKKVGRGFEVSTTSFWDPPATLRMDHLASQGFQVHADSCFEVIVTSAGPGDRGSI